MSQPSSLSDGKSIERGQVERNEIKIEGKEAWKNFEEQSIAQLQKITISNIYLLNNQKQKRTREKEKEKIFTEQSTINPQ